jgi:hypothetical protein
MDFDITIFGIPFGFHSATSTIIIWGTPYGFDIGLLGLLVCWAVIYYTWNTLYGDV